MSAVRKNALCVMRLSPTPEIAPRLFDAVVHDRWPVAPSQCARICQGLLPFQYKSGSPQKSEERRYAAVRGGDQDRGADRPGVRPPSALACNLSHLDTAPSSLQSPTESAAGASFWPESGAEWQTAAASRRHRPA